MDAIGHRNTNPHIGKLNHFHQSLCETPLWLSAKRDIGHISRIEDTSRERLWKPKEARGARSKDLQDFTGFED
jgi:hypothetical protein